MRDYPAANGTALVPANKSRLIAILLEERAVGSLWFAVVRYSERGRSAMRSAGNGLVHRDRLEYAGVDCLRRAATRVLVSGFPKRPEG